MQVAAENVLGSGEVCSLLRPQASGTDDYLMYTTIPTNNSALTFYMWYGAKGF
jgi:hypothetical protein